MVDDTAIKDMMDESGPGTGENLTQDKAQSILRAAGGGCIAAVENSQRVFGGA